jgi:hypothetical protein
MAVAMKARMVRMERYCMAMVVWLKNGGKSEDWIIEVSCLG